MQTNSLAAIFQPLVRRFTLSVLSSVIILAALPSPAATLTVTNSADNGPGTMRQAIASAASGDTINFEITGTIFLTTGELAINANLNIVGPGQSLLTVSGSNSSRVFNISAQTVSISGLTIANGGRHDAGGGIYNAGSTLTLNHCTVSNNSVQAVSGGQTFGGGIYNGGGTLTLNYCSVRNNWTANGVEEGGGGIYNNGGTVILNHSTFAFNHSGDFNVIGPANGAGLCNNGGFAAVNNCTFSENFGTGAGLGLALGGGIYNFGTLNVSNSTISGNSVINVGSAGGIYHASGVATIRNTIIAGNNNTGGAFDPDVHGICLSQGFNLIGKTNGSSGWVAGDLTGSTTVPLNPMLGPLQDNGGPTFTMALLSFSPALDAGNRGGVNADQRGYPRPSDNPALPNSSGGDGSDIGAYETGLDLTLLVAGGGRVVEKPDQTGYAYNQTLTLTAVPAAGWRFSGWSGNASGTANPLSVSMTSQKTITANFVIAAVAACVPPPTGLVSWWPGAGNANDIVGINNSLLEEAGFVPGKVGQGFIFSGLNSSDVVIAANSSLAFISQFTLEAWIKPADVSNYQQIFSRFRDFPSNSRHYQIGLSPNGRLRLDISGDNTSYDFLESGNGVLALNTWAHVAATFDSGLMKLYVNGAQVASAASAVTSIFNGTTTTATIGCTPQGNQHFNGVIDELSVYNRALLASEILSLYNAGNEGKCLTPVYITSLDKAGSVVDLSWLAQKGMFHQVQYNAALNGVSPWIDVGGAILPATSTGKRTIVVPSNAPQRLYRVKLSQ